MSPMKAPEQKRKPKWSGLPKIFPSSCHITNRLPIIVFDKRETLRKTLRNSRLTRRQYYSGPSIIEALHSDVLQEIAEFAIGDVSDLSSLSLLSCAGRALAKAIGTDENAKLYENEFKNRDPVLHECIIDTDDRRSTWKMRIMKIIRFKKDIKLDQVCLDTPTCRRGVSLKSTAPLLIDVTLYNHQKMGFLVNVGETSRSIVIYGLRIPPRTDEGGKVKSSAQKLLGPLSLPLFETGEPAPQGPSQNNLVMMYSINGKCICEFSDFHELIDYIKSCDDLCRWRMLFYKHFDLESIPTACQFMPRTAL